MKRRTHGLRMALALAVAFVAVSLTRVSASAQEPNQVGLVVDFGNGTVATRCVVFNEAEITGYDVLQRSGLPLVAQEVGGMGVTICDIGGVSGCSASDCFCECQGMTCTYWRYYHLEGGSWQYSPIGASAYTVQHGDVEGWAWAEEDTSSGTQPPVISFDQICGSNNAPTATEVPPTPMPTVREATTPPPTMTPSPVATMAPSPTPTPTRQGTPTPVPAIASATTISPTAPLPTQTPLPQVSTATAQPETANQSRTDSTESVPFNRPASYVVFGLIVAGLLSWLFLTPKIQE